MENTNRGTHGDSLPMLAPTGASNRKSLPLGMGHITAEEFCKMLSEAEHNVCPTCGQRLPDGYTDDELLSPFSEDEEDDETII